MQEPPAQNSCDLHPPIGSGRGYFVVRFRGSEPRSSRIWGACRADYPALVTRVVNGVYGPLLHASFMATGILSFAAILAADVQAQLRKPH